MALTPGTCLGPYEVTALIGVGGMGEVYRARGSADRAELFSMSLAGGVEKTIGFLARQQLPSNPLGPSDRLTLTPDGTSVTYSTFKNSSNLWLMDGLKAVWAR